MLVAVPGLFLDDRITQLAWAFIMFALMVCVFAIPTLLTALPLAFWVLRLGLCGIVPALLSGAGLGGAGLTIVLAIGDGVLPRAEQLMWFWSGAGFGMLFALIFWLSTTRPPTQSGDLNTPRNSLPNRSE